jgi:predicted acetyltransferase
MKLIDPSIEYESSYIDMMRDFEFHKERFVPFTLNEDYDDFTSLVERLEGYAKGEGVLDSFVEHKSYWLIDTNDRIVGTSNFRLRLNERLRQIGGHIGFGIKPTERGKGYAKEILAKTLIHAKNIGSNKVLLTCDKPNIASSQVIKNNGGILHSEGTLLGHPEIIQRYWIKL